MLVKITEDVIINTDHVVAIGCHYTCEDKECICDGNAIEIELTTERRWYIDSTIEEVWEIIEEARMQSFIDGGI